MRKVTQVDLETGEDLGGFVAVIRPKQKSSFERHFTMNQAALKIIATELNHEQTKVLMMLLADLDYENYILVAQIDIAESLGMKKPNVSKAVKNLIEFGIILEGPKIGRSKTYRLNPQFGWKGTVSNHKKALKNGLSVIQGGKV
ncbi:helix-turn-helix domain-containing protein [Brevibacterium permense]|uniref:helix-turn-helix domain-containing protein n=1 Tax=Brevibacterium permense TaxID=234834 RepID=UPI0021D29A68|nr:helix-turn-helix domain-containing protein [Brevibacterium permense]MCU4295776.1 helix-turn-helix domain-containing protein [Brevibacterium permense]